MADYGTSMPATESFFDLFLSYIVNVDTDVNILHLKKIDTEF